MAFYSLRHLIRIDMNLLQPAGGELRHTESDLCLDMADRSSLGQVYLAVCTGDTSQKWHWHRYHGNA